MVLSAFSPKAGTISWRFSYGGALLSVGTFGNEKGESQPSLCINFGSDSRSFCWLVPLAGQNKDIARRFTTEYSNKSLWGPFTATPNRKVYWFAFKRKTKVFVAFWGFRSLPIFGSLVWVSFGKQDFQAFVAAISNGL
jgi:hypothetical protein